MLKQTLKNLFKNYGPVLSVTAHRSVRMRGQAFVAFPDKEMAARAVKEIKGFPLYGKPIVRPLQGQLLYCRADPVIPAQEISFAKTQSDSVVKRHRPDDFDSHKEDRLKRKSEDARGLASKKRVLTDRCVSSQSFRVAATRYGRSGSHSSKPHEEVPLFISPSDHP